MYRRNFLLAAIDLAVPVSICRQPASLWVSKFCYHFQFIWHKSGRKIWEVFAFLSWIQLHWIFRIQLSYKVVSFDIITSVKTKLVFSKWNRLCVKYTVKQNSFLSYRYHLTLFYCYWMSLNHFATSKSFGKFVSQSAMNGFVII